MVTDPVEQASLLSKAFSNVFDISPNNTPMYLPNVCSDMTMPTFSVSEVERLLCRLDGNKNLGPDRMHPAILAALTPVIALPLTTVFNQLLDTSVVPKDWSSAIVSPFFKSGDKSCPQNYRPIRLTSILSKIMEKLLRERILSHLQEQATISG